MISLYLAYILAILEYCSPLLLGISDGLNNKLEDTNYYILRTILGLSKSTEYSHLLNIGHLQTLQALVLLYNSSMSESIPGQNRLARRRCLERTMP